MKKKKSNELLKILKKLFDRSEQKRKVKRKHVEAIIDDLKKRENTIKKRLESEESKSKIRQLTNELEVIQAQRKKGENLLEDLRDTK